MFEAFIESLWVSGRRRFEDLTTAEVSRAVAMWCQYRPIDTQSVTEDRHVQDRIAHRLFEYFDALATGEATVAHRAELGLSQLFTAAARADVERRIRRHFETNARLREFLTAVRPVRVSA